MKLKSVKMKILLTIYFAFSLIILQPNLFAQTNGDKNSIKDLEKIRSEIVKISEEFAKHENAEKNVLTNLNKLENEILLYEKMLDKIESSERNIAGKLRKNRADLKEYGNTIEQLKEEYKKRAVNYYKFGSKSTLELLLESGSLSKAAAVRKYYKSLADRDRNLIKEIKSKKNKIANLNDSYDTQIKNKKQLFSSKMSETEILKNKKKQRNNYLTTLRNDKNKIKSSLNEKKTAEKYLLAVINNITNKKVEKDVSEIIETFPDFEKEKGTLPWPVKGIITNRMGITKKLGRKTKTEDRGIEILTKYDMDINAVAKGRVSMIKWLPWYGQTIFVQHGNGFYTVYGRVSDIQVGINQIVEKNQFIAKSKTETGTSNYKLSFQIWSDGKSLDPEEWIDVKSQVFNRQNDLIKKKR